MTQNRKIRLGRGLDVLSLASACAVLSACAAGPLCPELGDCGGDPNGTWVSNDAADPGCVDGPYFTPTTVTAPGSPLDGTLFGRPAPVAGQAQAQPTLADWCEGLVLEKDLKNLLSGRITFVFQDPKITKFSVAYNSADSSYVAGFVRSGRFGQYYSKTCLSEFGQNENDCPAIQATIVQEDATQQLPNVACTPANGGGCDCAYDDAATPGQSAHVSGAALTCKVAELIMNKEGTNETYKNVSCAPDLERGGCNCGFDAAFSSGETGFYELSGSVITNHPQDTSIDYPSQITFCQRGDSLDISGYGSSYLYNKAPVRTFHLSRATTP